MRKIWLAAAAALLAACASAGTQTTQQKIDTGAASAFAHPSLSPEAILGHVNVLASDEFEGRAPNSAGEQKTMEYLERTFRAVGLEPGAKDAQGGPTFLQEVPLVSSFVEGNPTLTIQ